VLVGDLNIAPLEHDVWSHKQLLDVVSHTPVETAALTRCRRVAGVRHWHDALRHFVPDVGPEALHVVVLPRGGLARLRPRAAAGPCLGLAGCWTSPAGCAAHVWC
jgi:hypothetical protein